MSTLDLAVVGNCTVASLIDRDGRHVWHCAPRLDGDPVFNALLGGRQPQSGFMDVAVRDRAATRQRYLPNSAVLETVIDDTRGGSLKLLDCAPRFRRFGRMFRPPQLVRRIEPLAGRPRIAIRLRPDFEYGARKPQLTSGSNHVRYVGTDAVLRLTTDAPISYVLHETEFVVDRPLTLIVGADETVSEGPDIIGRTFLQETELYWQDWVRDLHLPFDWQEAVIRAAITLKLCSYEDTGAVLAALTTSVPEHEGSGRCWDYRYCWLRDA
ncbi:MAG TPA: trehalase-like domain-containing protein, partial [Reyranellaceae bacterium]|nr:trehalase-like domain-containing protein [Reyranellaceae bacterium]